MTIVDKIKGAIGMNEKPYETPTTAITIKRKRTLNADQLNYLTALGPFLVTLDDVFYRIHLHTNKGSALPPPGDISRAHKRLAETVKTWKNLFGSF